MKPHYHALSGETITDAHIALLAKHAKPHTWVKFCADRALANPANRYARRECAKALNEFMGVRMS